MQETTLYQKSESTGKGKIWIIRVDDKGTQSEIVIRSGQVDLDTFVTGKLITNTAIVSVGKNIGKTNQTTHYTQAVSEAEAKVELQIRKGYSLDPQIAKGQTSAVLGSGVRAPMLAQKYHPTGAQSGSKTLDKMKIRGQRIAVQPKLDGNRCTIVVRQGEAFMYTRKGDLMKVQLAHILEEVVLNYGYNSPHTTDIVLDGELYANPDEVSFNVLNGLLKDEKATGEKLELRNKIKFHLYDIMEDVGYEERYALLQPFASEHVEIVETKFITATEENINTWLEYWLNLGYEGLMIRLLNKGYENKRAWQLVKVKIFEDAEFKLVGFVPDVRGGFVGKFIMQLPEPVTVANGKVETTFGAGASGQSEDDRRYMMAHPDEFIGKMATIEFFGRSEYSIPRFGKFKGVRE